jgi:hypothetical protein
MYKRLIGIIIPACLLSLSGVCNAAQTGETVKQSQPAHNHRGEKKIALENADGATITLWKPDLSTQLLSFEHGEVTIPKTGVDNYHVIVAEKDWGDHKEAVIRYEYRFGRPSKQSPSKLAAAQKTEFEIVPEPIPREHYRYHTHQHWGFLTRFKGAPAGDLDITLTTTNGTQLTSKTDVDGFVSFEIPDDFPEVIEGDRDKRLSQFTVASEYISEHKRYTTQLNADYRLNPSHWQSTQMGLLVVGIGFITGGFLGRVRGKGGKAQ